MSTKLLDAGSAAERDASGPRSLMRVLRTFALLSREPRGMSMAELTAILDTPKSSLVNLVRPLVSDGYLVNTAGVYRLGPAMFRMSAAVLSAWNFAKTIRPFMEELSQRTRETVLLGVLNKEAGVLTYLETIDSPHPVRYHIEAGTTRPLYASSAGRLLLAYADPAWTDDYLDSLVIKTRTAKPTGKQWLRTQMPLIRDRGCEWAIDHYMVGLASIAAPIMDSQGHCIASLNIAGPSHRFSNDLQKLVTIVKDVAGRASGIVGPPEPRNEAAG